MLVVIKVRVAVGDLVLVVAALHLAWIGARVAVGGFEDGVDDLAARG
jgi:hypothetical protein